MMKKIIVLVVVIIGMSAGLIYMKWSHPSLAHRVETIMQEMQTYELEGKMQMLDGEDLRTFQVKTTYLLEGEQDYFAVELEDQSSHQQQKIIRNQDGVFVIAPSLNRAFQFKSDWPFNSFKPYIMQSVFSIFDAEYNSEKIDNGYLVDAPITYASDPRVTHMTVTFDNDLKPKNVTLLDDDETEIVMLDMTSFQWNSEINKERFEIKNESDQAAHVSYADDLPFYPLEMMGSELIDQSKTDIYGIAKHILRFDGEEYFTIVENVIATSDEFQVEVMEGDILEINGSIAIVTDEVVSFIDGDVICQVYSDDLSTEEKLQVLSSMKNSIVIEP